MSPGLHHWRCGRVDGLGSGKPTFSFAANNPAFAGAISGQTDGRASKRAHGTPMCATWREV
jgi:hypothetical protein